MLTRALHVNIILWLAAAAVAAQLPDNNKQTHLLVRIVGFKLVAADIKYEGAETESGVCLHYDPLSFGGRNYYWSDAMTDGLFVDGGESAPKIYQPSELAFKAGWRAKLEDDETYNNIWGLFESGGKIWMGSDGLGILEFDPRSSLWSRYDWQYQAEPGATTYLAFADGRYLFFHGRGVWLVYSRQRDACAQLANPLDSRVDASQRRNGTQAVQFRNSEEQRSFYASLESEFARLASGR